MALKPISLAVLELGEEAAKRLDHWRTNLLAIDAGTTKHLKENGFLGQELRGAAVIATMAEVERLLREFLIGLSDDVNASRTEIRFIVPSMRTLVGHSHFESLNNTKQSDTMWSQRSVVTAFETDTRFAELPSRVSKGAQPPLDGKTITDAHILRLWKTLGLDTDPFPKPSCATSLRRLASLRNGIAHGNQPLEEVLRSPQASARDLAELIDDVALLIINLASELSDYARLKQYRVVL